MIPQPWEDEAACREIGPDAFFPSGTGTEFNAAALDAKTVCRGCPVQQQCLAFALAREDGKDRHSRGGIWGGLTGAERAALRPRAAA